MCFANAFFSLNINKCRNVGHPYMNTVKIIDVHCKISFHKANLKLTVTKYNVQVCPP